MSLLEIQAFNGLEVVKDGETIRNFRSIKERALLAYLATQHSTSHSTSQNGKRHSRVAVAGLLWPDDEEPRARRNLSQTLLNLRKAIGEDKEKPFLDVSSKQLGIHKDSNVSVDVVDFLKHLVDVEEHEHESLTTCEACTKSLQKATEFYTGPFLDGFYLAEADLFEEWMLELSGRLERNAVDALISLSQCFEAQDNLSKAQQTLRRVLAITPWQESAHQNLMRLLAQTGNRSQALNQFELCSKLLKDELGVAPTKETLELHQKIIDGTIEIAKQPVTTSAQQNQQQQTRPIPFQAAAPPEHFSGRITEIAELKKMLLARNNATVGIVAMGGAGKSALALAVARDLKNNFKDGVLWASIASSTPLDILDGWAQAYGYDYSGLADIESKEAALRGVLAEKEILFILDDVGKSSKARALKVGGEKSAVLLTTRDQDVAIALNAKTLSLPELLPEASLEILTTILGQERIEQEVDSAKQICELLQHLPLAVEIAAKRLKSRQRMKLEAMVARLSDTQSRLDLEISDLAVRSSFEVSWEALDFELRTFFPLLAIFEGRPFTAEALAYISGTNVYTAEDYLYTLQALSMVGEDGSAHYKQHPLLADFAKEKQEDDNFKQHLTLADFAKEKLSDPQDAYAKMADYYYSFAKENSKNYDVLNPEWGNMIAAIGIAHKQENWQLVIDFTDELTETWMTRGRYKEARNAYTLAKNATEKIGDKKLVALNLIRWGKVCIEQNDYKEAKQYLHKSLELESSYPNIADAKYHLARISIDQNRIDEALVLLNECKIHHQDNNSESELAKIDYQYLRIHYESGEFELAESLGLKALSFASGNDSLTIEILRHLGLIAISTQKYDLFFKYSQEVEELITIVNDKSELVSLFISMAWVNRKLGYLDEAVRISDNAIILARQIGGQRSEAMLIHQLSLTKKEQEKHQEAMELEERSLEIYQDIEDPVGIALALLNIGDLYHLQGQQSESQKAWSKVEALSKSLNDPWFQEQLSERLN